VLIFLEICRTDNFEPAVICICFMWFRPFCGIRGTTLIVNLPGSKKGSQVTSVINQSLTGLILCLMFLSVTVF